MDRELERLRREKDEIMENFNTQLENYTQTIEDHLTQVRDEYLRVAKFSGQAGYVLDKIDQDFKEKTKRDRLKLRVNDKLRQYKKFRLSQEWK